MSLLQGEFDGDGRHVHPYVRDPEPDASAPGFTNTRGQEVTQEFRSRESRLVFHTIEGLLGHLTPLGMAYLMEALTHRLYTPALAEEIAGLGMTPGQLDPRGELLRFEELHRSRLATIHELISEITATCPGCGRRHGAPVQPGAYVHAQSGDAVRVLRVADGRVYVWAQVDTSGREVRRIYEAGWFEANFVPADQVEVLASS